MYQSAIPLGYTLIVTGDFVHLEISDLLPFVIGTCTNHCHRTPAVLPSSLRIWIGNRIAVIFDSHTIGVEILVGFEVRNHFPSLIVGPRIVFRLICRRGSFSCDEYVNIAIGRILYPCYLCYFLGTQGFLRLWLIHFAVYLDMQTVFHVRIEGINPTGVRSKRSKLHIPRTVIGLLRHVFRTVTPAYRDLCACHHLSLIIVGIDILRTRQGESI